MKFKSASLIFLFSFLFLLLINCSNSTEVSKGSLTGVINLEDSEDHSDISVAVYELAYLDTTITRINSEYPHIGVIINQHTEFDHRLQTPIKTGTTAADGSFELKNIPTGTYNFVAQKAGYGFRYLYEISISNGDNLLEVKSEKGKVKSEKSSSPPLTREIPKDYFTGFTSHLSRGEASNSPFTSQECKMKKPVISTGMEKSHSYKEILSKNSACIPINRGKLRIQNSTFIRISGLTLFPEMHLSGDISEEVVVEPYHHLVCDDDVTFVPGSRLEIQPGVVVRIAPGADLTIMGNLKAQGEEENMFWVTSNDGFADDSKLKMKNVKSKMKRPVISTEMEKSPDFTSAGRDTLALYNSMELTPLATVENDLIEWGKWDWGNTCLLNEVDNVTMQDGIFRNGSCGFYSTNVDVTNCSNVLARDCFSESDAGIYFNNDISGIIESNIILSSYNGIKIKSYSNPQLKDNYIIGVIIGIDVSYYCNIIIKNNILKTKQVGVDIYRSDTYIKKNIIFSEIGINTIRNYYNRFDVNYNNFNCNCYCIYLGYYSYENDSTNNFYSTTLLIEIMDLIFDKNDVESFQLPYYGEVIFEPYLTQKYTSAGIQ